MIEEKYIELINQEIDGVNSPRETAKLKDYLAASAEARQLYDELVTAANMLRQVKPREPSVNLKRRVLGSIHQQRYAVKKQRVAWSNFREFIRSTFVAPSYQLKYAYAFAVGLMAGLFIYALLSGSQSTTIDNADLYGTMIRRAPAGSFTMADSMVVNLGVGHASMLVKSSPSTVIAELSLSTSQEVKIQLEFDENTLAFSAISQVNSQAGNAISVNEHLITLNNRGENEFSIIFANKSFVASTLHLKLFHAETLLYETTLTTAKEPKSQQ